VVKVNIGKFVFMPIVLAVLTLMTSLAQAGVVVIGNPGLGVSSLSADLISDIYLAKTVALPDGTRVKVVDQQEGSSARKTFYSKVIQKDETQLKAYWAKQIFTGKATPPDVMAGDKEVKAWVAGTQGGIGYVDDSVVDGTVKVLYKVSN
jgi:ABC-type phosphate transport system substrate-binding protein